MKYALLTLFLLVLTTAHSYAQQEKVLIRFIDARTEKPAGDVVLTDKTGAQVAKSDSNGYCTIPFGSVGGGHYLLAAHAGYSTDTLGIPADIIYLQPRIVDLSTATVRGEQTGRLLRAPNEYVADYIIAGNKVMAATYSGNNGGKAKLFLLSKDGDIITRCKLPEEPQSLYQSCSGTYYCICRDRFYPVMVSGENIELKQPYPIALLKGLQQCDISIKGNFFYRLPDRLNFRVAYGIVAKGDSIYRPLARMDEKDKDIFTFLNPADVDASIAEYNDIMRKWGGEEYHEAYRRSLNHKTWDLAAIAHINIPLFATGDTLVIFDYYKKRILYYSHAGRPLGQAPISFEWRQSQQFELLKDEPRNRFYIHRYDNKSRHILEELDVHTGTVLPGSITISRPFPGQVKVNNGDIYFLWQNGRVNGTRQLYVQRQAATAVVMGDE